MSKSAVTWKGINIYMNSTQRVKLYKSGKNWVTMTIATAAMAFGVATSANQITAYADTAAATPTTAAVSDVKSDASTPSTTTTTATTTTPATTTTVNQALKQAQVDAKTGWQQGTDKSWTYYNADGKTNTGREYSLMPTIGDQTGKSKSWYLMQDGKALSGVQEWMGSYWNFNNDTYTLNQDRSYFQSQWGLWYLSDHGQVLNGVQEWAGSYWHFDSVSYLLSQKKNYVQSQWGNWYLVGDDGRILNGVQEWAGSYWYFDPTTNLLSKQQNYVQSQWGSWYMVGNDGRIQSGLVNWMGSTYYFDPVTYLLVTNKTFKVNGVEYQANAAGQVTKTYSEEAAARDWIAQRESGGNYNARNGIYYGKYQLTISYLGGDLSPQNQDRVADAYVKNRYGSWVGAKNFWLSHHWY